VARLITGAVPPVEVMLPAVPVTDVTAVADEMADHEEPDHTYIVLVAELKYVAPTISALPWLSRVGAVDLEPRYSVLN
jgi:hypothetical protein